MTILELALAAYNIGGTTASIIGAIDDALRRAKNITAEDLFKKSLADTVKQSAQRLAHFTASGNPETVEVDGEMLDNKIASLKDTDLITLTSLEENERLTNITTLFSECIILPGHQLTAEDFEATIRPILAETIAEFYNRLPFNQGAFNQIILELIQNSSTNQAESNSLFETFLREFEKAKLGLQSLIIEHTQAIKNNTNEIKKTTQATHDTILGLETKLTDLSNRYSNVLSISDAVATALATEHKSAIDDARDLLKHGSPRSALNLLEKLKQRIWTDASTNTNTKFRILTNMAASQLILNKEQEAAMLLLEAFQYNPEDERALSNRAFAHFLLGERVNAEDYAKKTLDKNPKNTDVYAILVQISTDEETLEEIIAKVPDHLRETSQIPHAISEIAKQRGNFEEAKKWGEKMVEYGQEDIPSCKATLAIILIQQVLRNRQESDIHPADLPKQLDDSEKEHVRRAIGLFTEAWACVVNTELRDVRTDWIINRSTAYVLLGETKAAIKDLDIAIEIEPSYSIPLKNRAILALKEGEYESAINFLERIQYDPESSGVPILIAEIQLAHKRFNEAISTLNDFLMTNPSLTLRENVNRLLIYTHIAQKDIDKAQQISTSMRESSPMSVLNLVDAAKIAKAIGKTDEALSLLEEAYGYAQNSQEFQELVELAEQLCIHEQFDKAAVLYEKFADTSQNSQWTERLLYSYSRSGEIGKALEICQTLREKYGPLKYVSEMEYAIYDEIGDMDQSRAVCEVYINAFPDDADMQIRLGVVHLRSNNLEEVDYLLGKSFVLKNLSLQSCFSLANLYRIRFQPEKALDIMYEVRRTYYNNAEAHLKYIGLYYQVDKEIGELLSPTQVKPGIAVYLEISSPNNWYIIEQREDADIRHNELNVDHPLAQRLLGKTVNDEVCLQQNIVSQQIGKITEIKSKYVHALQESFRKFSELFPDTPGLGSIKLDDSHDSDDSEKLRPLFDFIDRQDEASRQIEKFYKEYSPPIGVFANFTGRDLLDTWGLLMSKPDLGVRCSVGTLEERRQALALLGDSTPKLVVDFISLMTVHGIGAAEAVIKAFGKLGIAQSTIDELQHIINDREGMLSNREGMSVGKQGDQYVKTVITPEDVRRNIEYLKNIRKWIGENCEVIPINAALQVNQFRRRELDNAFQSLFVDTLLIASQPDYFLFSDDERLRSYAKANFSIDAGINRQIDGVWTQDVLEHCLNKNLLDKTEYDRMTIKLVCSHYYQTSFDADVLIEAAKQSAWRPSEPYSTLIQTLGNQKTNLLPALNVAVDFLYKLWLEPIGPAQQEYLTLGLLGALTLGRGTRGILKPLVEGIREKFILLPLAEQAILSLIQTYTQTQPRNLIHLASTPPTSFTSSPPRTSPEEKRTQMPTTAEQAAANGEARMAHAEAQFRQLCAERGLNWDTMTEAERENFVDDLVHEDRECSP